MRFRPSAPFDERILTDLPEVHHVERTGTTAVVTGTGELVQAVVALSPATTSWPTTCASSRPTLKAHSSR